MKAGVELKCIRYKMRKRRDQIVVINSQDVIVYELEKIELDTGAIETTVIDEWKKIEREGKRIGITSFRNVSYIVGALHALGDFSPVIIAENGGVIQIGIDNPPDFFHIMECSVEEKNEIKNIKKAMLQKFPQIWFMENMVILGIYPKNTEEKNGVNKYLLDVESQLKNSYISRSKEAIYIIPKSIMVQRALEYI